MSEYVSGCGVCIIKFGKVLLGIRSDGQGWCFAGGKVEEGENAETVVIREAKEEFGLAIMNPEYCGTIISEAYVHGELKPVQSSIFFTSEYAGDQQPDGFEILELRWFGIRELENMQSMGLLFKPTSAAINLLLNHGPFLATLEWSESEIVGYCPLCGEILDYDGPFCSTCGDVSGWKPEDYQLKDYCYYLNAQMKATGKVFCEPKNFKEEDVPRIVCKECGKISVHSVVNLLVAQGWRFLETEQGVVWNCSEECENNYIGKLIKGV